MTDSPNYIRYANGGAVRNQPLSPKLVNALSFLEPMGITAYVFSGGQPEKGSGLAHVGSVRHDDGNAGDMFFIKDGRKLDWNNPQDLPIFEQIVQNGKANGITGFGAGPGYMQEGAMHVGFGTPAVWGAKGDSSNAPDWLRAAYYGKDAPAVVQTASSKGEPVPSFDQAMAAKNDPVGEVLATGQGGHANAFAGEQAQSPAANALDAMAKGGVQPNHVQTVDYVPPPGSSEQGNFTPLIAPTVAPRAAPQPQPQATVQPPVQPNQATQSDDDILKQFLPAGASTDAAPQAQEQGQPQQSDDDILKAFLPAEAPAKSMDAAAQAAPSADSKIGLNDVVRSIATGVPIIGGALNKADAALNATIAPVVNPLLSGSDQLQGETWSDRYKNSLAQQVRMDAQYAKDHRIANIGGNIVGGVAGTIPLIAAAPAAMGASSTAPLAQNMLLGGISGAGIGAADAGVRTGGDLNAMRRGAEIGGVLGGAGPLVAKGVGWAWNKLASGISKLTPSGAAANNLTEALAASGKTADDIAMEMAQNPRLTAMDLDPNLQQIGSNLANQNGASRAVLKSAVESRTAGAKGAVDGAFDNSLGKSPDTIKILDDLRARQQSAVLTPEQLRSTLDSKLGASVDPKTALDDLIAQRSAQSQPLYQKALGQKVAWDNRLQQFLDDPIVQGALSKGVKIQRLESLADGTTFNPVDYAIKGFNEAGDPILGATPNMRTLNVVKKGLDEMVEASKNPTTGKLSEEGVAIDKVRQSFLKKLDGINPDYKAARASWEGPSKVREAFERGMGLFSNAGGKAALENTPTQIKAWMAKASPDEVGALKLGARASFERNMASSADQVDKVAKLTSNQANQEKLAALVGDDDAKKIVSTLNAKYTDPVGDAFNKGLDILRNRTGSAGLEDRPEFWQKWFDGASDAEKEAARQGARVAIDNQINSVRSAAAKGAAVPEVGFNRERLEILIGKPEADRLAKVLNDEQRIAYTNNRLFGNSATAERTATNNLTKVTQVDPGISLTTPLAAAGGYQVGGIPGALAGAGLSLAKKGVQSALAARDIARNRLMAEAISGQAPQFLDAANANSLIGRVGPTIENGTNRLLAVTRPATTEAINQKVPVNVPVVKKQPLEITVHPKRR